MLSGVQKLIKNEHPNLYDIECICHLADLTVKASMKTLLLDIDLLFIDTFYFFYHSSKQTQEFVDLIIKHCPTRWLS